MPAIQMNDWIVNAPLANGTYHFGLGGDASIIQSAQFSWDATLIGSIQIWTCDYPPTRVAINDVTAGRWIQQQPTTRYVAISPAGAATELNLTVTIPGGTAGGCSIQLGNLGSQRIKAIVTITNPGAFTYATNGKD